MIPELGEELVVSAGVVEELWAAIVIEPKQSNKSVHFFIAWSSQDLAETLPFGLVRRLETIFLYQFDIHFGSLHITF